VRWGSNPAPWRAILTGLERFLGEHAGRIHGDVLEVKGTNSRRLGDEVRCHVVDIDPENTEADLHADLNAPGSLPAEIFDCVILTQVLQFLAEPLGRVGIPARVTGYGNVPACGAARWSLSFQDLSAEELDVIDSCSPLVACAHADKPA
jgi:hypothetical protein